MRTVSGNVLGPAGDTLAEAESGLSSSGTATEHHEGVTEHGGRAMAEREGL